MRAAQEIVSRCKGTVKQVHEHALQSDPRIVKMAGAPHANQEEYEGEVTEANYELLEWDGC